MPFRSIMKTLIDDIPGATGAIFVDWEGEAVDQYVLNEDDTYNLKVVGAHKGVLLNLIEDAQKATHNNPVKSVAMKMENYDVLMAPVKDGYIIVMTMRHGTVLGKAHLAIKRAAEELKEQM